MLKKGQTVKFSRPMSTMRTVLQVVEQGHCYRTDIEREAGLQVGKTRSALYNLVFIGALVHGTDSVGRHIYLIPGRWGSDVAPNLKGIRSIFDVR